MTTPFETIDRLAAIVGQWCLSAPEGPIYRSHSAMWNKPFGICVSDVHFVEGEAQVTVKMLKFKKGDDASSARFLIGYTAPEADYLCVGLVAGQFAYALYQY